MNPGLVKNFVAGGTILNHRIVKFGDADTTVVQASAASDNLLGVVFQAGEGLSLVSGNRIEIALSGIVDVEYGGNVARGALLTANTDGKAVTASAGNRIIGMAMQSGIAGDIRPVSITGGSA